ncbi:serine-threonine protein kinase [Anopheles sinensis]|uniref:Serine-threonine protein kinase n=1 Tax=Anopheles sinensis TaxID=74873 RepID=A0A084VFE0_ANOSI|nr:serine-threonine protein kinase [Anopheles sinensis]
MNGLLFTLSGSGKENKANGMMQPEVRDRKRDFPSQGRIKHHFKRPRSSLPPLTLPAAPPRISAKRASALAA